MPQMIDLAEVEAGMENFRNSMTEKVNLPGQEGVVMRAQLVALPLLTIWRAKEINRGTDKNDVMAGILAISAAAVAGELMHSGMTVDEQFGTINAFMKAFAEQVVVLLTGGNADIEVTEQRFKTAEAGNA